MLLVPLKLLHVEHVRAAGPDRRMRRQPQRRTPLGRRAREVFDQLAQALRRLGRQVGRHRRGIQVF